MKRRTPKTVLRIDISDDGNTKIAVQQGRFQDMRLWGDLLGTAAKAVADAHRAVENPQKTLAMIEMGFLEEMKSGL